MDQQPVQAPPSTQPPAVGPANSPIPIPEPPHPRPEPQSDKLHPMVVLQPGERVVCTIKRHPFGIVSLYVSALFAIIVVGILAFVLLPTIFEQYNYSGANALLYGGLAFVTVCVLVVLAVATYIYWQSEWVVTTDSITQISQIGLFNRQVSQMSMDNLEDVTADQNGILPHMFNFGTLKVESAGERSKFQFPYCPDPDQYARTILEVHEKFLEDRRNIQNR